MPRRNQKQYRISDIMASLSKTAESPKQKGSAHFLHKNLSTQPADTDALSTIRKFPYTICQALGTNFDPKSINPEWIADRLITVARERGLRARGPLIHS